MLPFQKVSNDMKSKKLIAAILAIVLAVCLLGYISVRTKDHDHDHAEHAATPHGLDEHEDQEGVIELTAEEISAIGLETAIAGPGVIDVHISLTGEIKVNQDRMAHIVPTVPGIVRQVLKGIGDTVIAGEIIAWLESTEVGGAKLDYLTKQSEISCCSIETVRAEEVYDNTLKLLETLKSTPSLETLRNTDGGVMGNNRSQLVSAYAELIFARQSYLREKDLYEKKISSKDDFLSAQREFNKADAEYVALQDSISFQVKHDLLEARQAQQIREIELQAAIRLLYLHGLTAKDMEDLWSLAKDQNSQSTPQEECNDPDCTECAVEGHASAGAEIIGIANEKIAWYPIRSPFEGTIINKHITLGEFVTEASDILIVADLSSVWIDLHVYPSDLMKIEKGQSVVISADQMPPGVEGVISYVGPVVGTESRTATARVVLPNSTGSLRPGLFVTAEVAIGGIEADVLVPKDVVQTLDGKKYIFIKDEHDFEPSFVRLGQSNTGFVQILSGLAPGQEYVTKGAFALKSKIATSTLDSHAGHGH